MNKKAFVFIPLAWRRSHRVFMTISTWSCPLITCLPIGCRYWVYAFLVGFVRLFFALWLQHGRLSQRDTVVHTPKMIRIRLTWIELNGWASELVWNRTRFTWNRLTGDWNVDYLLGIGLAQMRNRIRLTGKLKCEQVWYNSVCPVHLLPPYCSKRS